MLTSLVGPVEVFFYWPEAVLGNFYWPGAIGSPLTSSPVYSVILSECESIVLVMNEHCIVIYSFQVNVHQLLYK